MEPLCAGQMLITDAENINKIVIHPNGLKKHSHALNHTAQALYWSILAFGLLLLYWSFHLLYDYIVRLNIESQHEFPVLETFYKWGFAIFGLSSSLSLFFGYKLLIRDYPCIRVALALNRTITFLLCSFGYAILLIAAHLFVGGILIPLVNDLAAIIGFLILFIIYYYLSIKPGCKIKKEFKEIYSKQNEFGVLIEQPCSKILRILYDEMDSNATNIEKEWNRLTEIFENPEESSMKFSPEHICQLSSPAKKLFDFIKSLNNEIWSSRVNAKLSLIVTLYSYSIRWDDEQ